MSEVPATPAPAQPPRRPWYRLHLSTWFFLALVSAVLVLLMVPGEDGLLTEWRHGWPWTYCQRDILKFDPVLFGGPSWRNPAAWSLHGARQFRLGPVAGDLLVALSILTVAGITFEFRRRRHRIWQFTLRELLTLVLLTALSASWWKWHHDRCLRELAVSQSEVCTFAYCGPDWLLRLVGHKQLEWLDGIVWLGIVSGDDVIVKQLRRAQENDCGNTVWVDPKAESLDARLDAPWGSDWLSASMPYTEEVRIQDAQIGRPGLQRFADWPRLSRITIAGTAVTEEGMIELARLRPLKSLSLQEAEIPLVALRQFAQASRIEEIQIRSIDAMHCMHVTPLREEVLYPFSREVRRMPSDFVSRDPPAFRSETCLEPNDEVLDALANLYELRLLHIAATSRDRPTDAASGEQARLVFTAKGIESLVRLPKLESLILQAPVLHDACFAALTKLPRLRHLTLITAMVTEVQLLRLKESRSLEVVEVCAHYGDLSDRAMQSLQEAMPRIEIRSCQVSAQLRKLPHGPEFRPVTSGRAGP